jgi:GDPmannose 4,6-dehydratase
LTNELRLGNLESRRDWGFAGDYVEGMWLMLQQGTPEDFVIGTGVTQSVRDLCDLAFSHVGLDYNDFVVQDPRFYRPAEVDLLVADPSKAVKDLEWQPKIGFEELIHLMVDEDLKHLALEID